MDSKKTLLEKYNIPISHLDFAYVEKCNNAREMEKIVNILRSGEEGYFPDLTRCAEQKLKQLKPNSNLFRFEEQIKKRDALDPQQELKPIYDWTKNIKTKDNILHELKDQVVCEGNDLPIRQPSKIDTDKDTPRPNKPEEQLESVKSKSSDERIKSTDYKKWDKYDPDVELLRMDLEEERAKEELELKNNLSSSTSGQPAQRKIYEMETDEEKERLQAKLNKLTQVERETYAEKYRLCGNDYFRTKEYDSAIAEYSMAIIYDPTQSARAYNNRAISHLKLKNYEMAIADCKACLQLEPNNVRALLRLADANYFQGRRLEAKDIYQKVLEVEPKNVNALKAIEKLQGQLGEVPPAYATRLTIEDHQSPKPGPVKSLQPKIVTQTPTSAPPKEYDLAELVKPNRVIKSKLLNATETFGQLKGKGDPAASAGVTTRQNDHTPELRLPMLNNSSSSSSNKLLIQEI